ncbi:MAG: uroporphyrinogen-III synthase [Rhodobacteraceae bacterium]|nr:uroporphyrinogen-III synthase [Paracoccaceae bacterium]
MFLTRPQEASLRFWESMSPEVQDCVRPVISPMIDIRPGCVPDLAGFYGTILTSANAVPSLMAATGRRDLICYCVGEATAAAATVAGFSSQAMGGDADALVSELLARRPKGPLVHLRGAHSRGAVADRLTAGGLQVAEHVVYDQTLQPLSDAARQALMMNTRIVVPVFSPRSAAQLGAELTRLAHWKADIHVVAISAATWAPLSSIPGVYGRIAARPDAAQMRKAVQSTLDALCRVERLNSPQ